MSKWVETNTFKKRYKDASLLYWHHCISVWLISLWYDNYGLYSMNNSNVMTRRRILKTSLLFSICFSARIPYIINSDKSSKMMMELLCSKGRHVSQMQMRRLWDIAEMSCTVPDACEITWRRLCRKQMGEKVVLIRSFYTSSVGSADDWACQYSSIITMLCRLDAHVRVCVCVQPLNNIKTHITK